MAKISELPTAGALTGNEQVPVNQSGTTVKVLLSTISAWISSTLNGFLTAANNLSDLTDKPTARTNLGVAIGTDVQAYDATILKAANIGTTVQGYDADIPTVAASKAEMEAGTETALRSMSPLRVKEAIAALATSGYLTGQVVQVVQTVKTDGFSVSGAADTWYDVTGVAATITPRSASNKILVIVNGLFDSPGTLAACGRILRGSTPIGLGNNGGGPRIAAGFAMNHYNKPGFSMSGQQHLDSPGTASAVTYKVQVLCGGSSGGTLYVGFGSTDAATNQHPRVPTTITLLEIAA